MAIVTGKSFVVLEERGERQIEPSSSWFPPQVPSGMTVSSSKANDLRNRERAVFDLFSKLKMGEIQGFLW